MAKKRSYWGYRINTDEIDFFSEELDEGRLRQGWGWDKKQNLQNLKMDEGARRNLSIYNKVKKGDILLIPRCPTWEEVTIAEAKENFDAGYKFEIDKNLHDYGHIFPAVKLKSFVRNNSNVSGDIRASLKNPSRFWNMDSYGRDIDKLIRTKSSGLSSQQTKAEGFENSINKSFKNAFDIKKFSDDLFKNMLQNFSNEEWEFALTEGLKKILPEPVRIERTGGKEEKKHGCDIMIRYPGVLGIEYIVGIQVKDYHSEVSRDVVDQVCKIDKYFEGEENCKVIDKIVIITESKKDDNSSLEDYAYKKGVKVIFTKELQELLCKMGRAALGLRYE